MFLTDYDLQHVLERVQAAFPSFTQWTDTNASDDARSRDGFALWGQWVLYPEETMARHCYVTFATQAEHWSGHLTIGQVAYPRVADNVSKPLSFRLRRVHQP